jgi:single-strand DNA-binding protein
MKNLVIAGKCGKDAQTRDAGSSRVTSWSVAVDDGWGDKKTTLWFDCSWWGQRGEKVAQYIRKGDSISVSGSLSTREYEGKTILTLDVTDVTLQGGGQGRNNSDGGYSQQSSGQGAGGGGFGGGSDMEDEIPW